LQLQKPILVGHSFGGQEVSDIATRYPSLIAGAVYLDAVYSYDAAREKQALYWNVEWRKQIEGLQKHLAELLDAPFNPDDISMQLRDQDLPAVRAIVDNLVKVENGRPLWTNPGPNDLVSIHALREWYHRVMGIYLPEAEFRETETQTAGGKLTGAELTPDWVGTAVQAGRKAFHHIDVPALYIGAEDNVPRDYDKNDPQARQNAEAYKAYQHGWISRRTEQFTTDAPKGRLVILQGASHMIFASNPDEVVREILTFNNSLAP
jgi:pimeloyl-ACP methyl ester carboxylesterase